MTKAAASFATAKNTHDVLRENVYNPLGLFWRLMPEGVRVPPANIFQ